jgi:hypothetical protein
VRPPPSRVEWAREGEFRGHTVEETIRYLSDCADWADELQARRAVPAWVITGGDPPASRAAAWLRRWFGRR